MGRLGAKLMMATVLVPAAEGIRVPAKTSTPSIVVYGEDDRMI